VKASQAIETSSPHFLG